MTTYRFQCGSLSLELDSLSGALTFEDFLSVPKWPQLQSIEIPKIDIGPSFSSFGIPFLDAIFSQILDKLDLFKRNVQEFTNYLNKLFKNAINWTIALAGIVTVSQLIPVLVREITGLVLRWKRFHEWEKENKDGKPEQIPKEDMTENPEEIEELSGEDLEPPSICEEEVPQVDELGNLVLDENGKPVMALRCFALPVDISDYYDSIPEPDDLSEDAVSEEAELTEEENQLIKVDDTLIKDLIKEFDPQDMRNEENCEYLLDNGVYILHIKNIVLKRHCIYGGDRVGWECKMVRDIIHPVLWDRYSHTYTIRQQNCRRIASDANSSAACCSCYPTKPVIRVLKRTDPIWKGNECRCYPTKCTCPCHEPNEDAVVTYTKTCNSQSYGPNLLGYSSECSKFEEKTIPRFHVRPPEYALPSAYAIIRYEDELVDYPYNSHEWCDFCKVMYKYYTTTMDFKYHKSNTDAYIFFSRGKESTIFEKCKDILMGIATDRPGNLLADWDGGSNQILEYRGITCKCDTPRPTCTPTYAGWASEVHTNLEAYLQGHAQTVKYLYMPDFDPLINGDPWWYDDPHDYQSIKKRCIFEGILEHKTPEHVFRFYTYRKLTDKNWFPRLYKEISDALNKNYPDIPSGADEFKPLKTRLAWQAINKKLSDVVPIPEIYPELAAPEKPLFESRPEDWETIENYGPEWVYPTQDVPPSLELVLKYLKLLNKYYPGWKEFRDNHEPGWWRDFWKQIPDISGIERTTIFLESDTSIDGNDIIGEPEWWRSFWGPTIRDQLPDPDRPKSKAEVLAVMDKY